MFLVLIWVGFVGVHFEVCAEGGVWVIKTTPCLKLVRIMLETWKLVRKYTHVCSFRNYSSHYQGLINFDFNADISIFCQRLIFLSNIVLLIKSMV